MISIDSKSGYYNENYHIILLSEYSTHVRAVENFSVTLNMLPLDKSRIAKTKP